MISCKNLSFSYNPDKHFTFPDFTCDDAQTLLILGQSGRGKTTLLHLMALLLTPTGGNIQINDSELAGLSAAEAAKFRAANVGIVYQKPHFVKSLSVMDNLLMANYLANQQIRKDWAKTLAKSLGFDEHLNKPLSQLSQGEQQRVSIARALMNRPKVVLADEPTSSLDDLNCQRVIDLLTQTSQQIGASLVIVTHDQRLKDSFSNQITL